MKLSQIVDLYRVDDKDPELLRAQFRAFSRQVPLMYFIVAIDAAAISYTYAKFADPWLAVYIPACLCAIAVFRGLWWARSNPDTVSNADAIRQMRTTSRLAIVLTLGFLVWSLSLFPYGDAYAQGQVAFFGGLTQISCIFCLMHLRSAAFGVATAGIIPYTAYFFFAANGHLRAEAINLALVSIGMIAMLTIYNRDFAKLINSERNLTARHEEAARLSEDNYRLANLDSLSGLPNRRSILSALEGTRAGCAATDAATSIVFIDLDGFKDVNDTYGHDVGDQLIRAVANGLTDICPPSAQLARLGGDEFAILVTSPDAQAIAEALAGRILAHLAEPLHIGERTIQIGASIGLAGDTTGGLTSQELFRRADTAMYDVKTSGKGGFRVYGPELDDERNRKAAVEQQIRNGLDQGEFEVHYQPVIDARSNRVVALEALLRWPRRPDGPLGPDQFIPVAESSGLIHALGQFVLERACRDALRFDALKLCVNVSPAQFRDPELEAKVEQVLRATDFPAHRLELEITEGYLIDHPQRAAAAISALKEMGMSVALDDFGTGYTSIAYLRKYGFSRIKIDKSIAGQVTVDKGAQTLVAGTVYLANGLDMEVTAEGVETEDQARLLRLAGCQCLQGYIFGRPVAIGDLAVSPSWFILEPERGVLGRV